MSPTLRRAVESDRDAILDTVAAAFGPADQAELTALVTELSTHPSAQPSLSLVAADHGQILGHILFTNALVETGQGVLVGAILAPLSVRPDCQSQGIGGQLIEEGLRQLQVAGVELVFVLGHPEYYPRHGFTPAGVLGLDAPYPIAPENADAWMVQALRPGILGQVQGTVLCSVPFDDPRHWRE